ncbi:NAD(P)-dependent oxidoreductase [Exiguobacterium oxidotolerans]|uniref:Beta-hydroxyacid dehydrogenase (Acts on 3-hydroxypropionate with NADP) n=1 Tax=Exiguobacterium oxidotolerans TaxID=223958 RepID=A0A653IER7_9BACL|nr:NAD(P)-dependent oxidoreductase [Exiguobacterium oxidotolerans]VWX37753.1 beta-hydroxyacid dehydrogenase (acts on 3-hydroxypropionate with NADP) [Exiguobacterium oxidotolerans]
MTKTIGFIGLGVMGQGMVRNLLKAGFAVQGYNRTKEKGLPLEQDGATIVDTIKEAVTGADVVISIVGYPEDVEQIYFSEDGILANAAPGTIVIDMTTSSPALAVKIAEQAQANGLVSLDAPVTGGDLGAKNGTLAILVGGQEQAFADVKPLFEAMGRSISLFGGPGKGQSAKLANQIAIAGSMIGTAEMLLFVTRSGIDPTQFVETIKSGSAGSWSLENLIPRVIAENYSPGFFVKHFIKDMRLALERADELGIATPGLALVKSLYDELAAMGHGESGTQALYLLLAEKSQQQ